MVCAASLTAPTPAEPLPPQGIDVRVLHDVLIMSFGDAGDTLFEWMGVDHAVWGRGLAGRLDQARADCAKQEKAPQ